MNTNYRRDGHERIQACLRAKADQSGTVVRVHGPHIAVMLYCADCGAEWDSRTFLDCPVCQSAKYLAEKR